MQKVYLLLRSNQQTGPFSLEELLKFNLKPFDLIWIEGKSAGWYYPQEIHALRPHLSFIQPEARPVINSTIPKVDKATIAKKIFVALPTTIPQPATAATSPSAEADFTTKNHLQDDTVKTNYTKSLDEVETDYTRWVYDKNTKKKGAVSTKGAVAACLLVGVAIAAWLLLKPSAVTDNKESTVQQSVVMPSNENVADSYFNNEVAATMVKPLKAKDKKRQTAIAQKKASVATISKTGVGVEQNSAGTISNADNDYETMPPVINAENKTVAEEKNETVAVEAPKEKKKLREKIADLFKKKPKQESTDDAKPVEEANGQRNSTRREAGSNLSQLVRVQFAIPNDWMMGIKGAKATLTNRSSETVSKAVVEVVYYNDENEILDKKTITFNNIKSKQTQTVSVPDHSTATRLDYSVVSATGVGEPFARL